MQNPRRKFMQQAAVGALAVSAFGCAGMKTSASRPKRPVVLVHGAFMGAWAYQPLVPELASRGLRATPFDLPAHGLNARFPASYFARPLDAAKFGTEPSPQAGVTLDDHVNAVLRVLDVVQESDPGPVVLVGHSMGGVIITAVAEKAPERIAKLVYLTAFLTKPGVPAIVYIQSPENAGDKVGPILKADPKVVGALRIDPHSSDPNYDRAVKAAFFNDVSEQQWPAVRNLVTPDTPVQPFVTPGAHTLARWGRIPRAFIRCTEDYAIRPALQDRMIREADALTPGNKTEVVSIGASHAPFVSVPAALADALSKVAG